MGTTLKALLGVQLLLGFFYAISQPEDLEFIMALLMITGGILGILTIITLAQIYDKLFYPEKFEIQKASKLEIEKNVDNIIEKNFEHPDPMDQDN